MQVTIHFQGLNQSKEWPHFAWLVNINGETFAYRTGIGHAYHGPKRNQSDVPVNEHKDFLIPRRQQGMSSTYAVAPSQDDVLQALFGDSELGGYSFDEFCDNLGYSNDSLKALDTYRACAEIGKRLKACLGKEYYTVAERVREMNA